MQITLAVGAELVDRIVDRGHEARRDEHFGQPGIGPAQRLQRKVVAKSLPRTADLAGRPRRVQPHQHVEMIFQHHHHVGAAQTARAA